MKIADGWDLSVAESRLEKLNSILDEIYTIRREQNKSGWDIALEVENLRGLIKEIQTAINEYKKENTADSKSVRLKLANIPGYLVNARIAQGVSQKELADKLGTTYSTISKYEKGGYFSASLKRLMKIAECLGVDI